MADMLEYLAWRGDVSHIQSPWNDVDSLILATLSYLDYPQTPTALRDLAITLPLLGEDVIGFFRDTRALLSAASLTERFAGVMMHSPHAELDQARRIQFAAVTADLMNGSHYLAFRGTDNTIVGWKEDFTMAFESPIPAQEAAANYLRRVAADTEGPLILGGHSKGGNLAVYAAAHAEPDVRRRIRAIYSFDGPGVDDATIVSDGYAAIARRIRSFVPQASVVGLLMAYHPEYTVIRSTGSGLLQHDPFTWQVLGTGFVTVPEVDVSSQVVDQTVHAWLAKVTPEQRRRFVETLFGLLEATGATTMRELLRDVPGRVSAIIRALARVDFDTARMILSLLGQFVSIGTQNVLELIRLRLSPGQGALPQSTKGDVSDE